MSELEQCQVIYKAIVASASAWPFHSLRDDYQEDDEKGNNGLPDSYRQMDLESIGRNLLQDQIVYSLQHFIADIELLLQNALYHPHVYEEGSSIEQLSQLFRDQVLEIFHKYQLPLVITPPEAHDLHHPEYRISKRIALARQLNLRQKWKNQSFVARVNRAHRQTRGLQVFQHTHEHPM